MEFHFPAAPESCFLSAMTLYFDDASPGMVFTSGTHRMELARIKAFAAEFDPQPFHVDEAAAKNSFFGGLVASGWHTAAASMRLLIETLPLADGIVGSGVEIAWLKPVRPGDILQVRCEITKVTPSASRPDRGSVTIRSETLNQHGEVVQIFTSTAVLSRRPV